MPSRKRRNYFIDKKFQSKIIVLTVLVLTVYTLVLLALIFIPIMLPLDVQPATSAQSKAAREVLVLHSHIWPAVGIAIAIMGAASIFLSHKVAGPAYRLNATLDEISEGNLDIDVKLRKGDELQSLADRVNEHLEELRFFVKRLHDDHTLLSRTIEAIESAPENNLDEERLNQLRECREQLTNTLERYSTHR